MLSVLTWCWHHRKSKGLVGFLPLCRSFTAWEEEPCSSTLNFPRTSICDVRIALWISGVWQERPPGMDGWTDGWQEHSPLEQWCRINSRSRHTPRAWAGGTDGSGRREMGLLQADKGNVSWVSHSRCVESKGGKKATLQGHSGGKGGRICFEIRRFVFCIWRVVLFLFRILCSF